MMKYLYGHFQNLKRNLNQFKEFKMNEWKKVSEDLPPLDTPVWAGWFNDDGSFTNGIFVLGDTGENILWCLCDEAISDTDFGGWMCDDDYHVSHWMYLPKQPEE